MWAPKPFKGSDPIDFCTFIAPESHQNNVAQPQF